MVKRHVQLTVFGQWRRPGYTSFLAFTEASPLNTPVCKPYSEELVMNLVARFITFFKKALGNQPRQFIEFERMGNVVAPNVNYKPRRE